MNVCYAEVDGRSWIIHDHDQDFFEQKLTFPDLIIRVAIDDIWNRVIPVTW